MKGLSGGLRGPVGLWVLYDACTARPVEFLSSSWVSAFSAAVQEGRQKHTHTQFNMKKTNKNRCTFYRNDAVFQKQFLK